MSYDELQSGVVLHYPYLWGREADRGETEGRKQRPTVGRRVALHYQRHWCGAAHGLSAAVVQLVKHTPRNEATRRLDHSPVAVIQIRPSFVYIV